MNTLTETFQNTTIRTRVVEGRMLMRAADVAEALGYDYTANYTRIVSEKYLQIVNVDACGHRGGNVHFVEEPGLWESLARTRRDEAEPFRDWLYEDVVPTIRKTGQYSVQGDGMPQAHGTDAPSVAPTDSAEGGLIRKAREVAEQVDALKQAAARKRREATEIEQQLAQVMPGASTPRQQREVNGTLRMPNKYDTPRLEEAEEPGQKIGAGELRLKRPIVVLDLETTGLDVDSAMITEIAAFRLVPGDDGVPEEDADARLVTYVNPEQEISDHVVQLTGITNEDVADAPTFADLMPHISSMVADADLMGYNAADYDVPLLRSLYDRNGSTLPSPPARVIVDPYRIEQALRGNKLSEVYQRYTGNSLDGAHRAEADTKATYVVLRNQIAALPIDGAPTPSRIADVSRGRFLDDGQKLMQDGDSVVVTFGEHDGKTLTKVREKHPGYFFNFLIDLEDLRPHILNHFDDLDSSS